MISTLEKEITFRYLKTRKKDGFLNIISIFSFIGISLGVAVLIIVMSVMNGFRTELINKIVGFNAHVTVKPYDTPINIDKLNNNTLKLISNDLIFSNIGEAIVINKDYTKGIVLRGYNNQDFSKLDIVKKGNFIDPLEDIYKDDPGGDGVVQLDNGITIYFLHTNRYEYQVNCENGTLGTMRDTLGWFMRKGQPRGLEEVQYPGFEPASSTVNLIEDLAKSLDSGSPPLGGIESARHGVEIMVAILESHLQNGRRIEMPLKDSSLKMTRSDRNSWQKGLRWREPKLSV